MKTAAIVPVKRFQEAKMRLSPLLSDRERIEVARLMLSETLRIIDGSGLVDRVLVVSDDPMAASIAKKYRGDYLREKRRGLNGAIIQGLAWCRSRRFATAAVLPSDLPLLSKTDVTRLLEASNGFHVTLSPSLDGGTNALVLTPPTVMRPTFGKYSFRRHLTQASRRGLKVNILWSSALSLDVDNPTHLKLAASIHNGTRVCRLVTKMLDRKLV